MSTTKPLWKLSVSTTAEAEDAVAELLTRATKKVAATYFHLESGVSYVTVFSDAPFPQSELPSVRNGLKFLAESGINVGRATVRTARMKREDWAESWKKHFHPIAIGSALLVKPSWSRRRARAGQPTVILDPGLSFGTGQHATTSFCLKEICRLRPRSNAKEKSFLDIGTGSGILAIAASKLGYTPVAAFDFDPESVRVAKANAAVNNVSQQLKPVHADLTQQPMRASRQYDLVCANLIANLLLAEHKKIVSRVRPGGTLVLAGILAVEFGQVQQAFADLGWELVASRTEKEWRSGSFRQR